MARRSKEELLQIANTILGEDTTDDIISFLEDIADSVGADEVEIEGENWEIKYREDMELWEQKYNDNDKMWRDKYRSRFNGEVQEELEQEQEQETEPEEDTTTLEELLGL